jgi:hypothetical protein
VFEYLLTTDHTTVPVGFRCTSVLYFASKDVGKCNVYIETSYNWNTCGIEIISVNINDSHK